MAAKTEATCQYRTLSPIERDICRLLAEHERTGRGDLRSLLEAERDEEIHGLTMHRALSSLVGSGYIDERPDEDGIERAYILTEGARRELQRRWCWERREILRGGLDE